MVNLMIDGKPIAVPKGTTIMEAAKALNIHIPSLCYLKDINEIAACRVCCVEVEGERAMVTSCNNHVKEGMVVYTNSPRARTTRRTNVQLILSQHDCKCATCVRSGNCKLQTIANDLGLLENPFAPHLYSGVRSYWTKSYPLYRDFNKCISCMRCVQICEKVQTLGIWDIAGTGSRSRIDVSGNRVITDADCALCGQCITHCPTGGLRERDDTDKVRDILAEGEKITVVQVAPAVRTAWGESFGLSREEATIERMAAALRRMGFNYIYDTNFAADLTIMEEGNEFLERLQKGELAKMPMFTSCCPGWVRFLKSQYPELTDRLSSAKSPQQMFGAIAKTWLAEKLNVAPEKICCISIMPCVAKKAEAALPTMTGESGADVDIVLTTRELVRMMRANAIDPHTLSEEALDSPMGTHTGAGVIFGATGGVMEAALRTAAFVLTGKNPDADAFRAVRTEPGLREVTYEINGTPVRCAVVSGLGNARKLIEQLKEGKVQYDFVEVMACPGGCVGGGGQPISVEDEERYGIRGERLYTLDRENPLRFSHENPDVQTLYREFLKNPLSERAHHLLHTDHQAWDMP